MVKHSKKRIWNDIRFPKKNSSNLKTVEKCSGFNEKKIFFST